MTNFAHFARYKLIHNKLQPYEIYYTIIYRQKMVYNVFVYRLLYCGIYKEMTYSVDRKCFRFLFCDQIVVV